MTDDGEPDLLFYLLLGAVLVLLLTLTEVPWWHPPHLFDVDPNEVIEAPDGLQTDH